MKKVKKNPQEEQTIDILKRVAKRIEEATIDIHDIRFDLKSVKLRLNNVEHNTELMKTDMEKMREELADKIDGLEARLHKRIEHVADLTTIEFGGKIQNQERRIKKLEHVQQPA